MNAQPPLAEKCDTTAAVATPSGRGAVAVVIVEGSDAAQLVGACFRPAFGADITAREIGRIVFGRWGDENAAGEEVVAARTSLTQVEIHCHGGAAAVAKILDDLAERGAEIVDGRTWRLRNAQDLIEAEADLALAAATTERAARVLLDQRQGALHREVLAAIEAVDSGQLENAAAKVATLLDRYRIGRRLVEPWRVVLAGPPNVGKSSLINRLLGYERAIVFDQPGTTRDVVTAMTALDGWACELSDTAGLRESTDAIEQAGVERARAQMERADLVILVDEVSREAGDRRQEEHGCGEAESGQWAVGSELLPSKHAQILSPGSGLPSSPPQTRAVPIIQIRNKCDLQPAGDVDKTHEIEHREINTSAITGEGIAELAAAIVSRLVERPPNAGEAVPFTERQARQFESAAAALSAHRGSDAKAALCGIIERP